MVRATAPVTSCDLAATAFRAPSDRPTAAIRRGQHPIPSPAHWRRGCSWLTRSATNARTTFSRSKVHPRRPGSTSPWQRRPRRWLSSRTASATRPPPTTRGGEEDVTRNYAAGPNSQPTGSRRSRARVRSPLAQTSWPETIVCDSTNYFYFDLASRTQAFAVLAVWDYEARSTRGRLRARHATHTVKNRDWAELFEQLPGTPALVVCDGAPRSPRT